MHKEKEGFQMLQILLSSFPVVLSAGSVRGESEIRQVILFVEQLGTKCVGLEAALICVFLLGFL